MTPVLTHLHSETQFSAPIPAGHPLGEPIPMTRTAQAVDVAEENVSTGVWECTPGRLRRQIMQAEYSHFTQGRGVFTPDDGAPIPFQAGDAIYFSANTHGVWEIIETVRKTYLILGD